jgi:hypothetical protein
MNNLAAIRIAATKMFNPAFEKSLSAAEKSSIESMVRDIPRAIDKLQAYAELLRGGETSEGKDQLLSEIIDFGAVSQNLHNEAVKSGFAVDGGNFKPLQYIARHKQFTGLVKSAAARMPLANKRAARAASALDAIMGAMEILEENYKSGLAAMGRIAEADAQEGQRYLNGFLHLYNDYFKQLSPILAKLREEFGDVSYQDLKRTKEERERAEDEEAGQADQQEVSEASKKREALIKVRGVEEASKKFMDMLRSSKDSMPVSEWEDKVVEVFHQPGLQVPGVEEFVLGDNPGVELEKREMILTQLAVKDPVKAAELAESMSEALAKATTSPAESPAEDIDLAGGMEKARAVAHKYITQGVLAKSLSVLHGKLGGGSERFTGVVGAMVKSLQNQLHKLGMRDDGTFEVPSIEKKAFTEDVEAVDLKALKLDEASISLVKQLEGYWKSLQAMVGSADVPAHVKLQAIRGFHDAIVGESPDSLRSIAREAVVVPAEDKETDVSGPVRSRLLEDAIGSVRSNMGDPQNSSITNWSGMNKSRFESRLNSLQGDPAVIDAFSGIEKAVGSVSPEQEKLFKELFPKESESLGNYMLLHAVENQTNPPLPDAIKGFFDHRTMWDRITGALTAGATGDKDWKGEIMAVSSAMPKVFAPEAIDAFLSGAESWSKEKEADLVQRSKQGVVTLFGQVMDVFRALLSGDNTKINRAAAGVSEILDPINGILDAMLSVQNDPESWGESVPGEMVRTGSALTALQKLYKGGHLGVKENIGEGMLKALRNELYTILSKGSDGKVRLNFLPSIEASPKVAAKDEKAEKEEAARQEEEYKGAVAAFESIRSALQGALKATVGVPDTNPVRAALLSSYQGLPPHLRRNEIPKGKYLVETGRWSETGKDQVDAFVSFLADLLKSATKPGEDEQQDKKAGDSVWGALSKDGEKSTLPGFPGFSVARPADFLKATTSGKQSIGAPGGKKKPAKATGEKKTKSAVGTVGDIIHETLGVPTSGAKATEPVPEVQKKPSSTNAVREVLAPVVDSILSKLPEGTKGLADLNKDIRRAINAKAGAQVPDGVGDLLERVSGSLGIDPKEYANNGVLGGDLPALIDGTDPLVDKGEVGEVVEAMQGILDALHADALEKRASEDLGGTPASRVISAYLSTNAAGEKYFRISLDKRVFAGTSDLTNFSSVHMAYPTVQALAIALGRNDSKVAEVYRKSLLDLLLSALHAGEVVVDGYRCPKSIQAAVACIEKKGYDLRDGNSLLKLLRTSEQAGSGGLAHLDAKESWESKAPKSNSTRGTDGTSNQTSLF